MTQHNVGALLVVKSGQDKSIAGIVTERGIELFCLLAFKLCLVKRYRTIFSILFEIIDTLDQYS
jgi:hypothetical protein